jgi:hypothetical protein
MWNNVFNATAMFAASGDMSMAALATNPSGKLHCGVISTGSR